MSRPTDVSSAASQRVIRRIKAEHLALARVIASMQAWVVQARDNRTQPDGELFEAMLRYVEEVPDRFHHPQEDRVLFPPVSALPGGAAIVSGLEREHAAGASMIEAVRRAHEALRQRAPNALNRLSTAVDEFAEFYWAHMRMEEDTLLPFAVQGLDEGQWQRIEAEFEVVNDPLFTSAPAQEYRRLYGFIAERAQGPIQGFVQEAGAPAAR